MDTRTHTPVRPSWAERARTVLAAAASASVLWDGGRVDLLGCHHDDPLGDVILTLESTSTLVRAVREADGGALAVTIELTELCAVSTRERVRARVTLAGQLSEIADLELSDQSARLLARIAEVTVDEPGPPDGLGRPDGFGRYDALGPPDGLRPHDEVGRYDEVGPHDGFGPGLVSLADYQGSRPDPLHAGAAEQLQHLAAHHPDAIDVLSRLCDREALIGVTRVLPIALDRYGIVLRVERLRDHRDVRLPFDHRIDNGSEAAVQMRALLARGARRRPCGS